MTKMKSLCIPASALALSLALLCISRDARALGPVDLEVGAKLGYGSNPSGYAPNPLGVEVGGRVGVAFFGFYGGSTAQYNLGGSTQSSIGQQTYHSYQYGVELGYGFKIPFVRLIIRPTVGIGNYVPVVGGYVATPDGGQLCGSPGVVCTIPSALYLEPGVTAFFTFGRLFVGGDVNLFILPAYPVVDSSGNQANTTDVGVTAHAQIGVRF